MYFYIGKIDLDSAESQWDSTIINKLNDNNSCNKFNINNTIENPTESISPTNTTTTTVTINTPTTTNIKDSEEDIAYSTDITLIANSNVYVETMSWIQVIRNKYGFKDSLLTNNTTVTSGLLMNSNNMNNVLSFKPGRTASASLIAAEINKNNL